MPLIYQNFKGRSFVYVLTLLCIVLCHYRFLRIFDATKLLAKRSSLPSPIVIKPDLTREERAIDSAFLRPRWNLIQSGTDKKSIRLKGNDILINKLLYARLVQSSDGSVVVNVINNQLTSTSQGQSSLSTASSHNQ